MTKLEFLMVVKEYCDGRRELEPELRVMIEKYREHSVEFADVMDEFVNVMVKVSDVGEKLLTSPLGD